jgi:TolB protein
MRSVFLSLLLALATAAVAQQNVGIVELPANLNSVPISIDGSPDGLVSLARVAFDTDGAYRRVSDGATYRFTFTQVAPAQVRVAITRAATGGTVYSEVVAGTSARNALLRAADIAVEHTSRLRGYFAGKLAFISNRGGGMEIMTSDLFGGDVVGWPGLGRQILGPHWAPDGQRLIFTSYRDGFPDIYVLDLRTRVPTVFASFRGTNTGARYSPDGGRVAMVLTGEGNAEIYVSNAEGRMVTRLTRSPMVKASPCWSPDGRQIAFASEPGPQIYVMQAVPGAAASRIAREVSRYCAEPDWCRWDANKLAFTMAVGRGYQIGVYDFTTGRAQQVSHAWFDAIEPCWLPDGRHLIYTERSPNRRSLWILDTVTRRQTRISPAALGECSQASYWMAP